METLAASEFDELRRIFCLFWVYEQKGAFPISRVSDLLHREEYPWILRGSGKRRGFRCRQNGRKLRQKIILQIGILYTKELFITMTYFVQMLKTV